MDFTKPSVFLAHILRNKLYNNAPDFGFWKFHDQPVTNQMASEAFTVNPDSIVWTSMAKTEEEQTRSKYIATVIGRPRPVWWNRYRSELRLPVLDEKQLMVFWAEMKAGPVATPPLLMEALGLISQDYDPVKSPMTVISMSKAQPPTQQKSLDPSAPPPRPPVTPKQLEWFGQIGTHSLIALNNKLFTTERATMDAVRGAKK